MRERYAYAVATTATRPLLHRIWVALLLLTGLILLILEHSQAASAQRLRQRMLDALSPVMAVVSRPVSSVQAGMMRWGDYLNTVEENRRLTLENERLRSWQAAAISLKSENDNLRQLADYHPLEKVSYVTARVVGQSPGTYSQSLLLNVGSQDGVKPLQPVVDSYGLVGRIAEVGEHSARVLLLSDPASRVPVITGDSRQHAILAGTGDTLMRLDHLTAEQGNIAVGEAVVTTPEGALIPGGLAVGQVFRSDATGYRVKPMRPLTQAEYMRVVVQ